MPDSPDITGFLTHSRWQDRFDDDLLAAARSLVGKVRAIEPLAAGDEAFTLRAQVANEETEINAWTDHGAWNFDSSCTCETGSYCHHAAALLHRVSRERDPSRLRPHGALAAQQLPTARDLLKDPPPDLPRLVCEPRFELDVSRDPADRATRLLLKSLGQPEPEHWISAAAFANYQGHRLPLRASAPDWATPVDLPGGQHAILQHDAGAENAAAQQLRDAGFSSLQSNPAWRFLLRTPKPAHGSPPDRWFPDPGRIPVDEFWFRFRSEWAPRLTALGWTITIAENVGHRVFEAGPELWQCALEGGDGGWFSLSVGFDVAGERLDLLPVLTKLLEGGFLEETLDRPDNGHIHVPMRNGDALRLPVGRVRAILRHLAALLNPSFHGRARVHLLDAANLAESGLPGIAMPPEIAAVADQLRHFTGIEPVPPARGLQATLRDYQLAGFHWMQFLARHGLHGILADDMGLGKTLQTLTHALTEKESGRSGGRPALVVAPTSVVPNWRAEALRFTPGLRVLVLGGPERKRYFRSIAHADLVLTSYALLARDIDVLAAVPFHLVVLDEAQNIKNPRAKTAQAACKLQAAHRLCLSGTPIENHLGELWSLMRFLIPGFLGSEDHFNQRFRKAIEKNGDPETREALKHRVAPLILRRTKDQVARELPPKTELVHLIELHTSQKDLYETVRATMDKRVRQAIAARGLGQCQIVFLDALLKLRQICCDPRLLPDEFTHHVRESAKLDYLAELLEVLVEEGRRILLFSQFTTMLALIEDHLRRKGIGYLKLTGSSTDRGRLVADFQSGRVPLFLISLKAGGTGLNLTAADTVIHYDPWWNPAAEAQATDRAYRIGQTQPVFVHKLLCQDTVEERIHRLQHDKGQLAAGILADGGAASLDPTAVRALLDP